MHSTTAVAIESAACSQSVCFGVHFSTNSSRGCFAFSLPSSTRARAISATLRYQSLSPLPRIYLCVCVCVRNDANKIKSQLLSSSHPCCCCSPHHDHRHHRRLVERYLCSNERAVFSRQSLPVARLSVQRHSKSNRTRAQPTTTTANALALNVVSSDPALWSLSSPVGSRCLRRTPTTQWQSTANALDRPSSPSSGHQTHSHDVSPIDGATGCVRTLGIDCWNSPVSPSAPILLPCTALLCCCAAVPAVRRTNWFVGRKTNRRQPRIPNRQRTTITTVAFGTISSPRHPTIRD